MRLELAWYIWIPAILSVLYGYKDFRTKSLSGVPVSQGLAGWLVNFFVTASLTVGWSMIGFPLTIFYLLFYVCLSVQLLLGQPIRMRNWFLLNLKYVGTLVIHMVFIGVAALFQGISMAALLSDPFWRAVSVCAVLIYDFIKEMFFLSRPDFSVILVTSAQSEEIRPFMIFLCFCMVCLQIDSMLCVFELESFYPPLFLIGSNMVVMFVLIRFLIHISVLIQNNYLKEEHDILAFKLEAAHENANTLKNLADKDTLTGAFSRRYAMERMDSLIGAKSPFSLIYMDLDGLKQINDNQGHDAGDRYLIRFVQAVGSRLREGDLLARVGGDEFIILMPDCAADISDNRIQSIRGAIEMTDHEEGVLRFSYGATYFQPGDGKNTELLIREADRAMYQDKVRRRREGEVL